MEPSRFDDLTKALATATSRRQALKTFAATTIGGILGLAGIENVFAKGKPCTPNGKRCNAKTKCCSGFCDPTTRTCATSPTLGCTAGSLCETACPDTSTPFCACGTTMAGAPVCYLQQNGCPGQVC